MLTLRGHTNGVKGVAINRIASVSHDTRLKLWSATQLEHAGDGQEQWPVVIADNFEREQIGDRWMLGGGRWSLADGQLKAVLSEVSVLKTKITIAKIFLAKLELPETVELRFDVLSEVKNGIQAVFINEQQQGEVVELLSAANPWNGSSGATLYEQNGFMQFSPLTANREYRLEPGKIQHVRILRTPNHLSVSVNDREICSTNHSTSRKVALVLSALYGPRVFQLPDANMRWQPLTSCRMMRGN